MAEADEMDYDEEGEEEEGGGAATAMEEEEGEAEGPKDKVSSLSAYAWSLSPYTWRLSTYAWSLSASYQPTRGLLVHAWYKLSGTDVAYAVCEQRDAVVIEDESVRFWSDYLK
eukprot:3264237-Rhodomonas_salina.1